MGASSDPTVGGKAAKPTHRRRAEREGVFNTMPMWRALRQMPAQAGRLEEGRGEAESYSGSDEARRPRHRSESTGSSRHLNLLNRPVRTRMPGGVGGEGPQGSPLSRSDHALSAAIPYISDRGLGPARAETAAVPAPSIEARAAIPVDRAAISRPLPFDSLG
jgi:hypothetical protein